MVLGLAAVLGARFGFDTDTVDSPLIGQPTAEHTLPLLEADGEVEIPGDFDGEVLVVSSWVSWCVPCRAGIPETFVIDRDGTVAARIVGQLDHETLSEAVEDELAGREPGSTSGGDTWSQPGG